MALVKLKRDWFGPGGVRYRMRDGLIQIPDSEVDQVPSDATVYDDGGKELPSKALGLKPGFGLKPTADQIAALVPGNDPVSISVPNAPPATEKSEEAAKKEADEEQAAVTAGLAAAEKAQEIVQEEVDPAAAAVAVIPSVLNLKKK